MTILKNCSNWTVYKHTSPDGRVYIGITSRDPQTRWANGNGYSGNEYFSRAIHKYGWDSFSHEILCTGLTKENAELMEIQLIAEHCSTDRSKGFNISHGGSATAAGLHWKRPSSGILRGENHPMYGKSPSEETKKRIGDKLRGKHLSEETRQKMRGKIPWNKGRPVPEDERKRISESLKGNVPPNRRPVRCVELDLEFESMAAAMKFAGVSCIWTALQDTKRTAGGYHWQYVEPKKVVK